MSPVAVGIGVALVALVVIWLVASIQRRPPGEEAQRILDEARREAKAILTAAEAKAAEFTAAAAKSAERKAAQMTREAGVTAGDIIKTAEEKSWDLVAAAELQRTQARREAIQVRKLADGVRCDLVEMVSGLLAEAQRSSDSQSANGHAGTNGASTLKTKVGSD